MGLWPLGAWGPGLSTSIDGYPGQEAPSVDLSDSATLSPEILPGLAPQLGHPISLDRLHFNDLHLNEMTLNTFFFSLGCKLERGMYAELRALREMGCLAAGL